MSISEDIAKRARSEGLRFYANDNISSLIEPGELKLLEEELTEKFTDVLKSLVIDVENDPNSRETGHRMAKMYLHEIFRGRYYSAPKVTAFPNSREESPGCPSKAGFMYTGLLVIRAEIKSTCSHHHAPVTGTAYIGILPGSKILGLSKYVRIAQHLARRGTLQEELTQDILAEIQKQSGSPDIAVYIAARHGCVENRGVSAHNSLTQTVELSGRFYSEPDLRKEFYDNIELQQRAVNT